MTRCGIYSNWSTTDDGVCKRVLCPEHRSEKCGVTLYFEERYSNLKDLVVERKRLEKEVVMVV